MIFALAVGIGLAAESPDTASEIALLKQQMAEQQKQIDALRLMISEQQSLLAKFAPVETAPKAEVASASGMVPASVVNKGRTFETATSGLPPVFVSGPSPAPQQADPGMGKKLDETAKGLDGVLKNLGGFKFSGDFRYRLDVQARTANSIAGPLQNIRSRYRVRLNVDKEISKMFDFHVQLSTGPYTNETTNDQDFSGFGAKNPFSIAEAWVKIKPNKYLQFRVGRMEEVFADNQRFLWDDDVRLPGFEQIIRLPATQSGLFKNVEFRAAEYILVNPNVPIVAAGSPFIDAGFPQGTKIRTANLYDGGVVVKGNFNDNLSHTLSFNAAIYRNPNLIQLASTAAGYPIEVSNALGVALAGTIGQTGNATTLAGSARLWAKDYQIVRLGYKLDAKSLFTAKGHAVPALLDFQFSRNLGATSALGIGNPSGRIGGDAAMGILSIGAAKKLGDMRFLYSYSIKGANSLISQFTDDDLGTGAGVNTRVHALRFDLGLTKFLQFQNLLFIQDEISKSNPGIGFFVPVQRGANTTFRYLGHLAFTF